MTKMSGEYDLTREFQDDGVETCVAADAWGDGQWRYCRAVLVMKDGDRFLVDIRYERPDMGGNPRSQGHGRIERWAVTLGRWEIVYEIPNEKLKVNAPGYNEPSQAFQFIPTIARLLRIARAVTDTDG